MVSIIRPMSQNTQFFWRLPLYILDHWCSEFNWYFIHFYWALVEKILKFVKIYISMQTWTYEQSHTWMLHKLYNSYFYKSEYIYCVLLCNTILLLSILLKVELECHFTTVRKSKVEEELGMKFLRNVYEWWKDQA